MLNPKTGHVSPQFHIVFANAFDTVKQGCDFESLWQSKANMEEQLSETFQVDEAHTVFQSPWFDDPSNPEAMASKPSSQPCNETGNTSPQTSNGAPAMSPPNTIEQEAPSTNPPVVIEQEEGAVQPNPSATTQPASTNQDPSPSLSQLGSDQPKQTNKKKGLR